jgi:exosortase
VFGLVAIGMAPLTAVYFRNLWSQTHYQFFPVLIAAVVLLLISRWKLERFTVVAAPVGTGAFSHSHGVKSPLWPRLRPLVALAIVGLGIAIEFAAIWAFPTITPWGGYLGLLIAGFGVVMYVGQGLPKSLIPVWALMALILMPPENADDQLITYLQQRTASFTSQLLDLLSVDHIREGVMIEIASRKLFVEEACSGVQSLFSLLAVAAVLAVWYSRSLVHTVLLIVAAVAGAGAVNVLRTVTIVYGLDKVGIDLLSEPQHSILGFAVFLIAIGWLICCDAFLTFLIRPIDVPDSEILENVWVKLWNRVIAGFGFGTEPTPLVSRGPVIGFLCALGLLLLAIGGGTLAVASTKAVMASQKPGSNPLLAPVDEGKVLGTLSSLTEESIPKDFEGWKRLRFETVERPESNAFGEHSKVWVYSTPFGLATISVDYPFRGWHDLRVCYEGAGWVSSQTETSSTSGGHGIVDITQFSLQKLSGESAIVLFAAINEELKPVPTREGGGTTQTFVNRIQKALSATDNMDVIAQYQILVQSHRSLSSDELAEVHRRLNLLKARLIDHLQTATEVKP